ncbi:LysR family transcriptional regulator [Caulobacter sp. D4A]|uniref:LysR family transcriptional regulator n=1 Tax=unclassified Caulobacter TaxID=2648921 RepID=UPI000D73240B|nr:MULTISPECIES: LysR family transcriptional regulator [unclassified Caulobacter]PXA78479.1 LysR family transcriptional regulator [Caulobacter sp. D4A]PXA83126.1 LysR family transcriptional regulator [Caulobacter sp. D5]
MNAVNFRTADLNLFRVFVTLLEENNATRAGERLGLSQSAVSHALRRLREMVGDDLFVRGQTGLRPTPRALEIAETARTALKLLETAVLAPRFDPAVDQHAFNVAAGTYITYVLGPLIAERVMAVAPNVQVHFRNLYAGMTEDLDTGRLDMVIGCFEAVPGRFTHTRLFDESGVWVARIGHPAIAQGLDHAALARLPRLGVTGGNDDPDRTSAGHLGLRRVTSWGERYGLGESPDPSFSVQDSFSALNMVARSDMICILPRRLAQTAAERGKVVMIEPPNAPPPTPFGAVMRASDAPDSPNGWLLELCREAGALL